MAKSGGSTPRTRKLSDSYAEQLRLAQESRSPISLLVYHREGAQMVQLRPEASVVVGRAAPSDVTVPDSSLSRQHVRFTAVDGEVVAEDLGSTNGTFVGGARVERAALKAGDEVSLGAVTVTVHQLSRGGLPMRGLAGHERFRAILEEELARARFFGRPVSVLMVRSEVKGARHVRFWLPRVQPLLRLVDRLGMYSDDALEVILPESPSSAAVEVAKAVPGTDAPGAGLLFGIATFPDAATSAEELLDVCHGALVRATRFEPVRVAPAQRTRTVARDADGGSSAPALVAESAPMRELLLTATRVAKGVIPVLVYGETGTGKEVISQFIHEGGPRKDKPIVCVNCAAIPDQLLESTLFGHEKGAFTGAGQQQKGVFESADGGTVFLDEIGELPPPAQAALLRVLETKRFARVGSTKEIDVNVRVIAATHRDLEAMCESGTFRQDLLYRLNTLTIRVPALRDRPEDIEALAARFLDSANRANGTTLQGIDADALELLRAYAWPGNVRELKNALERAAVIAQGDVVTVDDLPEPVRAGFREAPSHASRAASALGAEQTLEGDFRSRMERLESEVLVDALSRAGWNQSKAARELSMPLRTLVYKIRMHGIKKPATTPKT
jgi:DNA-binding NtrC family response regulator